MPTRAVRVLAGHSPSARHGRSLVPCRQVVRATNTFALFRQRAGSFRMCSEVTRFVRGLCAVRSGGSQPSGWTAATQFRDVVRHRYRPSIGGRGRIAHRHTLVSALLHRGASTPQKRQYTDASGRRPEQAGARSRDSVKPVENVHHPSSSLPINPSRPAAQ